MACYGAHLFFLSVVVLYSVHLSEVLTGNFLFEGVIKYVT